MNHKDPNSIESINKLIEKKEIVKVKYQCIKVGEPLDINYGTISDLNIHLVDLSKLRNFEDSYDTIWIKSFGTF